MLGVGGAWHLARLQIELDGPASAKAVIQTLANEGWNGVC